MTLTPEETEIIKSYNRKMDMFYAIDEAFAKTNQKFDETDNAPSFQEMYESIEMLRMKIEHLERDAYAAYKESLSLIQIGKKPDHFQ